MYEVVRFKCFYIRTDNNLTYSRCSGWTWTLSSCFWINHHHGTEPSKGKALHKMKIYETVASHKNFQPLLIHCALSCFPITTSRNTNNLCSLTCILFSILSSIRPTPVLCSQGKNKGEAYRRNLAITRINIPSFWISLPMLGKLSVTTKYVSITKDTKLLALLPSRLAN